MGSHASRSHPLSFVVARNRPVTLDEQRAALIQMVQDLPPEEITALWRFILWWRSMPRHWRTRA